MGLMKPIRPDIIARFEGQRVPRYTSYPTAPHFVHAVDEADYQMLLRACRPAACRSTSMCRSAGPCAGTAAATPRSSRSYEPDRRLSRRCWSAEIGLVAAALPSACRCATSISAAARRPSWRRTHFDALMDMLARPLRGRARRRDRGRDRPAHAHRRHDPRRSARAASRAPAWACRSFDPIVQGAINRVQTLRSRPRAPSTGCARVGIDGINLDLMYGLPHQTVASLRGNRRAGAGADAGPAVACSAMPMFPG